MKTTAERLSYGVALLAEIEYRRREQNNPGLFWAVEQWIVGRELDDLERDCLPVPVVVRGKSRWMGGVA